jgi:exosortase
MISRLAETGALPQSDIPAGQGEGFARVHRVRGLAPGFLALGSFVFLWLILIDQLRIEWALNPQYAYGFAVPLLCGCLLWRRRAWSVEHRAWNVEPGAGGFRTRCSVLAFAFCAFLLGPTRLIQEANPEWRLIGWALASEVVGLTLLAIHSGLVPTRFTLGAWRFRLRPAAFDFPILFFLVAVPWPTVLEAPLIQGLTRRTTAGTTELLNWVGTSAIQLGEVIEVSTGKVGIDEACSGIRSVQASLMLGLFAGECYRLRTSRRWLLCCAGFGLALALNLCRTFLLVSVASAKGLSAIATWHDPAGVTILLLCFTGVWLLARAWSMEQATQSAEPRASSAAPGARHGRHAVPPGLEGQGLTQTIIWSCFIGWLLLIEGGVERWYRRHETQLPEPVRWTVAWPRDLAAFREIPVPLKTRQWLRYDEGRCAAWQRGGCLWEAIFLRWDPGRTAAFLARNHTPDVCLAATGRFLESDSDMKLIPAAGFQLPFRIYRCADNGHTTFVFYCLWEDRAKQQQFQEEDLTVETRMTAVRLGRRHLGQRSLELSLWGARDTAQATELVRRELAKLVRGGKPGA